STPIVKHPRTSTTVDVGGFSLHFDGRLALARAPARPGCTGVPHASSAAVYSVPRPGCGRLVEVTRVAGAATSEKCSQKYSIAPLGERMAEGRVRGRLALIRIGFEPIGIRPRSLARRVRGAGRARARPSGSARPPKS